MRSYILVLFLLLAPASFLAAQDDGYYDDGGDSSGYYDDGGDYYDDYYDEYDDGYYDDYYDDEYYYDDYYDDGYYDDGSGIAPVMDAAPNYFNLGLIFRGGWQGSVENTFVQGASVETMLNLNVYYVYFQVGVGWSSFWSNFGVEKAKSGGLGSKRSGTRFNEGMYMATAMGVIIPQIGLRFGAGVQMSFALLSNGFNINYSDEVLPYVEVEYDLSITPNFLWTVSVRSLISNATFSNHLPKTGRKATVELQTGLIFNFF